MRQLAAFNDLKSEFEAVNTSILGASVDPVDKAGEVQEKLDFPIAYGVTREQADSMGSWWEDRRDIIQPSEFILGSDGAVVSATYSTGPIGRLMPDDSLKLIKFYETNKLHLFDLSKDIGEKDDLAGAKPEVVAQLHDRLNEYLASVDAQMPQPNPNYDPSKPAGERRRRNNRRGRTQ